jgi:hypothetical protein
MKRMNDVLASLGRLRMTAMRYPGGNFASGYHRLDGIGPKSARPNVCATVRRSTDHRRLRPLRAAAAVSGRVDTAVGLARRRGTNYLTNRKEGNLYGSH